MLQVRATEIAEDLDSVIDELRYADCISVKCDEKIVPLLSAAKALAIQLSRDGPLFAATDMQAFYLSVVINTAIDALPRDRLPTRIAEIVFPKLLKRKQDAEHIADAYEPGAPSGFVPSPWDVPDGPKPSCDRDCQVDNVIPFQRPRKSRRPGREVQADLGPGAA
jgi:hypothetical protein